MYLLSVPLTRISAKRLRKASSRLTELSDMTQPLCTRGNTKQQTPWPPLQNDTEDTSTLPYKSTTKI